VLHMRKFRSVSQCKPKGNYFLYLSVLFPALLILEPWAAREWPVTFTELRRRQRERGKLLNAKRTAHCFRPHGTRVVKKSPERSAAERGNPHCESAGDDQNRPLHPQSRRSIPFRYAQRESHAKACLSTLHLARDAFTLLRQNAGPHIVARDSITSGKRTFPSFCALVMETDLR
jgi:hypothetical protein